MNDPYQTQRRLGRGMIVVAWLAAIGLLWLVFEGYLGYRDDPRRNMVINTEQNEMVLTRDRSGHYVAPGRINGRDVTFLLDTGATHVSVPAHLGDELGLSPGAPMRVMTANGLVTVRSTNIDELDLGPFRMHDVSGHLNPGFGGDHILLGMSVLGELEFTQRGGELIFRHDGE